MHDEKQIEQLNDLIRAVLAELNDLRTELRTRTKPLLTVEELAALTGRVPFTVRRWIREGRIRAERVTGTGPKGRLLIPREEVCKLITLGNGSNLPQSNF